MVLSVFTSMLNFEITESIIFSILVLMVNNLIVIEFSSKFFLNYISMLSNILTFSSSSFMKRNPYHYVTTTINFITTFPMSVKFTFSSTLKRTKSYWTSTSSMESFCWFSTIFTRWSWYESRHRYTIDGEVSLCQA